MTGPYPFLINCQYLLNSQYTWANLHLPTECTPFKIFIHYFAGCAFCAQSEIWMYDATYWLVLLGSISSRKSSFHFCYITSHCHSPSCHPSNGYLLYETQCNASSFFSMELELTLLSTWAYILLRSCIMFFSPPGLTRLKKRFVQICLHSRTSEAQIFMVVLKTTKLTRTVTWPM